MGRRYYCDYCDRSFQDNLHSRKKHLNGVQHQRCKKAWYDLFRGASELLAEEQSKKLCRRFLQSVLLYRNLPATNYLPDGPHFMSCPHHFIPLHLQNGMTSPIWNGDDAKNEGHFQEVG
uniref:Zinc finger matrin-type protein 5 n=1 Tax=Leptobrachium leishanense TaxID=445787 RepID=A0A8C5LUU3_9ANUR